MNGDLGSPLPLRHIKAVSHIDVLKSGVVAMELIGPFKGSILL